MYINYLIVQWFAHFIRYGFQYNDISAGILYEATLNTVTVIKKTKIVLVWGLAATLATGAMGFLAAAAERGAEAPPCPMGSPSRCATASYSAPP